MSRLHRFLRFCGCLIAVVSIVSVSNGGQAAPVVPAEIAAFDGNLSVMTYNIKGLPWPVATGRSADLEQIGARLRRLRGQGRNPHIVLLQEAFTQDAQAIGRAAGYRYIVDGPSSDMGNPAQALPQDVRFADAAQWMKGETEGKMVGSGLQILSDYPVVGIRRMAYPPFACAGYDCLANKGVLLVSVALPGVPVPIDIVTTHLNSRRASGVDTARSLYAYARQVQFLGSFLRSAHDPRRPLIVGGDFNVTDSARQAVLFKALSRNWVSGQPVQDALRHARDAGMPLSADARQSLNHRRDWQFFAGTGPAPLSLQSIQVPFGHDADGTMLSDHIGYTAVYAMDRPSSKRGRSVVI